MSLSTVEHSQKVNKRQLLTYIKEEKLRPVHNLGTHGHLDHHFGDAVIEKVFKLKPEVEKGDAVLMQSPKEAARHMFGMELPEDLPAGNLSLTAEGNINFGSHVSKSSLLQDILKVLYPSTVLKRMLFLLVIHSSREVLVGQTSLVEIDFRL